MTVNFDDLDPNSDIIKEDLKRKIQEFMDVQFGNNYVEKGQEEIIEVKKNRKSKGKRTNNRQ